MAFNTFYGCYIVAVLVIGAVFQFKVKELIVDEFFHVRQAQEYCNNGIRFGNYDPKLTTPAGPYIFSWIIHWILNIKCSLSFLRCTSMIYGCAMPWMLKRILNSNMGQALDLCLFPPLFFFHFLYYTDSGSVFWILFAYLASREKRYNIAGMCCFIAMTYRQTNIIWMLLILGLAILDLMPKKTNPDLKEYIIFILANWHVLIRKIWAFVVNIALFALFLFKNKGIVIGDKSNHAISLHIPQIYYFSAFLVFFNWDFRVLLKSIRQTSQMPLVFMISSLIMGWTISNFT